MNDCTNGILLRSVVPRVLIRELHRKSDLVIVDVLDEDLNLIAVLEDLIRVIDTAPAHL